MSPTLTTGSTHRRAPPLDTPAIHQRESSSAPCSRCRGSRQAVGRCCLARIDEGVGGGPRETGRGGRRGWGGARPDPMGSCTSGAVFPACSACAVAVVRL
jgi:hypothetical protein